jgi:hypothetical protein
MITKEVVDQLIAVSKKVFNGKGLVDRYEFTLAGLSKYRISMASLPDAEYEFFLEIKQSAKYRMKLTLHVQNTDGQLPLLRIDYNGTHKNPEAANAFVPEIFLQYMGTFFSADAPHIHYFVQGHGLDWAIPLSDDAFPVKQVHTSDEKKTAILAMAKLINLETILTITIQEEAV